MKYYFVLSLAGSSDTKLRKIYCLDFRQSAKCGKTVDHCSGWKCAVCLVRVSRLVESFVFWVGVFRVL